MKAINCAITAASAAPLIPKRTKGPIPKINKGSRIALEMEAIKTTNIDRRGLPSARSKLLDIIEKKRKGELKTITRRYSRHSGIISSVAPKKLRTVSWKKRTGMIINSPKKNDRKNICPAVCFAWRNFPAPNIRAEKEPAPTPVPTPIAAKII